MAYLQSHTGVVYQPTYQSKHYSGPNPYALGFNILRDVKRICENPTAEDKEWFPKLIGKRWQDAIKEAAFEHRDDSFIQQYLSPKVIRDMRLFTVSVNYEADEDYGHQTTSAVVSEIHDDQGYRNIRTSLARSKERINYVPQIVVEGADLEGDRTLYLRYDNYMNRELDEDDAQEVLQYLDYLWGYKVELQT
jgi:spore cortex formation protein SpoVR/YcgB (stage V sporulation)